MSATGVNLPDLEVTIDDWEQIVTVCRTTLEQPDHPAISCFKQYSVCPVGIFTPLSIELHDLYRACAGYSRIRTPGELDELPALYVDACDIINDEVAMLRPKNG